MEHLCESSLGHPNIELRRTILPWRDIKRTSDTASVPWNFSVVPKSNLGFPSGK